MKFYCIDTSAWHHSRNPEVAEEWVRLLGRDQLGICDQVRLEILYSAKSATEYDLLLEELAALREIETNSQCLQQALKTQRKLAHVGGLHHRSVKIADLIIAACAESAGASLLHYDADYDRIAAVTGQQVRWIATRGSL